MKFINLGEISFEDARKVQDELVSERVAGRTEDVVLFCEHPHTLSLGWRTADEHLPQQLDEWLERGVAIVRANRGGSVTYHGPGQLVIYPVVSLREHNLGVKRFVARGLAAIAEAVRVCGVAATAKLDPAGVWIDDRSSVAQCSRKIASVGLKIERGVTNHGFALNVCNDLRFFEGYLACGCADVTATSMAKELDNKTQKISVQLVAQIVEKCLLDAIFEQESDSNRVSFVL